MKRIARWLAGEVGNNTVGIKIVGGPLDGRTKIVTLSSVADRVVECPDCGQCAMVVSGPPGEVPLLPQGLGT